MHVVTTSDGSKTLYSDRYGQTYHSTHGAVTESRTVFLEGSRLQHYLELQRSLTQPVRILEIGFGLGLNFLLSADLALQNRAKLAYTAIEHDLINTSVLAELNYRKQLNFPQLADNLLLQLKQFESCNHPAATEEHPAAREISAFAQGVSLDLRQTLEIIDNWANRFDNHARFDIIYLDAFSPDTNPECWQPSLLNKLHKSLKDNGTLVTYSAKGSVRRGLSDAGFHIEKLPGPPGKREFLRASITDRKKA